MVEINEGNGEEAKVGNPWSILPIKNNKYAKDLKEVHLSDRSLTSLTNFEMFPNLEVIWLNNNNVSTVFILFLFGISEVFSYKTWTTLQATSASKKSSAKITS